MNWKKKTSGLIEISMRERNYCMFFVEANRTKIIDRIRFYIFPAVAMSCKVNILLFSSLLNMITASHGRWVGDRWVCVSAGKWLVVSWCVVRWSVGLIKPVAKC